MSGLEKLLGVKGTQMLPVKKIGQRDVIYGNGHKGTCPFCEEDKIITNGEDLCSDCLKLQEERFGSLGQLPENFHWGACPFCRNYKAIENRQVLCNGCLIIRKDVKGK